MGTKARVGAAVALALLLAAAGVAALGAPADLRSDLSLPSGNGGVYTCYLPLVARMEPPPVSITPAAGWKMSTSIRWEGEADEEKLAGLWGKLVNGECKPPEEGSGLIRYICATEAEECCVLPSSSSYIIYLDHRLSEYPSGAVRGMLLIVRTGMEFDTSALRGGVRRAALVLTATEVYPGVPVTVSVHVGTWGAVQDPEDFLDVWKGWDAVVATGVITRNGVYTLDLSPLAVQVGGTTRLMVRVAGEEMPEQNRVGPHMTFYSSWDGLPPPVLKVWRE